ncbi:signal transduction histidine kinase [Primorskyibacter sedentarius]|uniref:histidine kinase n=1 Tax=Primorskyibacter sedentarius TaxID=745311 RepID=A0A4R3IVL2_9RHOB|nr:HAMP domain-containing sensor histidine kinase [Primorskyibacter sedentarius]TCS54484.1 signal transduction histidine kinase [Primorskyibacter sedentarius]
MTHQLPVLLRSMPFRLALLLVALFAAISLLSFGATYVMAVRSIDQSMQNDLRQDMTGFRAAPSAAALAALVEAEASVTDPQRLVLSFISGDGRSFGNSILARDEDGYRLISLEDGNAQIQGTYLTLTDTLWGGQLTIARNRQDVEALRDAYWRIFALSLFPTIILGFSGALYFASRSARQVSEIGAALDLMTKGDLNARVMPRSNWSADLAGIGGKVDLLAQAQEASVATIKQVSSDIAHDLKTPLQRVGVHLNDLKHQTELSSEATDLIEKARLELDDMALVFVSLLQIAQIESGSARAQFAPLDLDALAGDFCELYEFSAADSGRTLSFVGMGETVMVDGDRTLLGQVLANLIENAIRHTPKGSDIVASVSQVNRRVTLAVTDNGTGIPASEHDLVLRRLYRRDQSRTTPGSGLGLSLVTSIAKLHNANVILSDATPGLRVQIVFESNNPNHLMGRRNKREAGYFEQRTSRKEVLDGEHRDIS